MPTYLIGKDCKVTIGNTNTVVGMGTWSISGVTADQLESTAFGDEWKSYEFGLRDGGTISFSGLHDVTDTTGQAALQNANVENTDITSMRFYVNNTSYYMPCLTTGYFSPSTTQNAATEVSYLNIVSLDISADKSGLVQINFSAKVSGCMVFV